MTNLAKYVFPELKNFDQFFVGFDGLMNRAHQLHEEIGKNIPGYPPYNVRKIDENHYTIEMALAGFDTQDIDIMMEGDKLTIKGSIKSETSDSDDNYLYKGIGMRAFTRSFALSDHVEVKDAELINGMLKVWLERLIPEDKKPKKIAVKNGNGKSKQLLTE